MTAAVTRIEYTQPTPDGEPIVVARMDAKPLQVRVPGPAMPGLSIGLTNSTVETRTVWLLEVLPNASAGQTALLGNLWEAMPWRTEARTVEQATMLVTAVGVTVWDHLTAARVQADQLRARIAKAVGEAHP